MFKFHSFQALFASKHMSSEDIKTKNCKNTTIQEV